MVMMVPHEAFACRCERGDVILRQAYTTENYGKLYYACPKSKPIETFYDDGFFYGKGPTSVDFNEFSELPSAVTFNTFKVSSVPSTHSKLYTGPQHLKSILPIIQETRVLKLQSNS
ncbi:hypothetical protein Tco_1053187 [Tanacetum coccineum]